MLENFLPRGDDANQQWKRRGTAAAVVFGCYLVLLLISHLLQGITTVHSASAAIIWFYLPIGLLLAAAGFLRSATWSVGAYLIAVVIGEIVSTPLYNLQQDFFLDSLPDSARPHHLGAWFAAALFLYITASAVHVEWDESLKEQVLGPNANPAAPRA